MPLYEYKCDKCGQQYEAIKRLSQRQEDDQCPSCRGRAVRVLSGFAVGSGSACATPSATTGHACSSSGSAGG